MPNKPLIAYSVKVRRSAGDKPELIYVYGNSPKEFVSNLKAQLKKGGYPELSNNAESNITKNLEKQVQQLGNLNFAQKESKGIKLKDLVKEKNKDTISEARDRYLHDQLAALVRRQEQVIQNLKNNNRQDLVKDNEKLLGLLRQALLFVVNKRI